MFLSLPARSVNVASKTGNSCTGSLGYGRELGTGFDLQEELEYLVGEHDRGAILLT